MWYNRLNDVPDARSALFYIIIIKMRAFLGIRKRYGAERSGYGCRFVVSLWNERSYFFWLKN